MLIPLSDNSSCLTSFFSVMQNHQILTSRSALHVKLNWYGKQIKQLLLTRWAFIANCNVYSQIVEECYLAKNTHMHLTFHVIPNDAFWHLKIIMRKSSHHITDLTPNVLLQSSACGGTTDHNY